MGLCYNGSMPKEDSWDLSTEQERLNWAWLAGLMDGEGSIQITCRSRQDRISPEFSLRLQINMTDPSTVRHVRSLTHCGSIRKRRVSAGRKEQFEWQAKQRQAAGILRRCLPYLVTKKREAEIALQFIDLVSLYKGRNTPLPPGEIARRQALTEALALLHTRGHKPTKLPPFGPE